MGLFIKKTTVYSPVEGLVKSIDKVADEMFAAKVLGDGFAVEPVDETLVSPIDGTVTSIFPTKHAISLKTKQGLEILLHIGIDTVELSGNGFDIKVSEGDKVTSKTKLAEVDFKYLKSEGKKTDVMVIFTNLDEKSLEIVEGQSTVGQALGSVR